MLLETRLIDIEEKEELLKKVDSLCRQFDCSPVELLIMSIDAQKEKKKANKNN